MKNQKIDALASVHPAAEIADDVEVGPWTLIGPDVKIGSGTRVFSHVVIKGPTEIGENNTIYQFSTVGEDTPDLKYKGETTRCIIGNNNIIREGVTIHRGTVQDKSETRIGNNNLLMAYVHIGHDSIIKDNTILVNNTALAGHVLVDDWAILSGYSLVHQYCHIGAHSFLAMGSVVSKDVPAYVTVYGNPAVPRCINTEGLRRRGFSPEEISALNRAYKTLYRRGLTLEEALDQLDALSKDQARLVLLVNSLKSSTRGIVR